MKVFFPDESLSSEEGINTSEDIVNSSQVGDMPTEAIAQAISPKIYSATVDKDTYAPGEQVTLTFVTNFTIDTNSNYHIGTTKFNLLNFTHVNQQDNQDGTFTHTFTAPISSYYSTMDIRIFELNFEVGKIGDYYFSEKIWLDEGDYPHLIVTIVDENNKEIQTPQVISANFDKEYYQAGESFTFTMVAKSSSPLVNASATFGKPNDVSYLYSIGFDYSIDASQPGVSFLELEDGLQQIQWQGRVPESYPNRTFETLAVRLSDTNQKTYWYDYYDEENNPSDIFGALSVTVMNTNGDQEPPVFHSATLDKESYQPGDKVSLTLEVSDASGIKDISVHLDPIVGGYLQYWVEDVTRISKDRYQVTFVAPIPKNASYGEYQFSKIGLTDIYENHQSLVGEDLPSIKFTVGDWHEDNEAPQILSAYIENNVYRNGDTITMNLLVAEESDLSPIVMLKAYSGGRFILLPFEIQSISDVEYGIIDVTLTHTLELQQNRSFSYPDIIISDVYDNTMEYYSTPEDNLSFDIAASEAYDGQVPHVTNIQFNKSTYRYGEIGVVTFDIKSTSPLVFLHIPEKNWGGENEKNGIDIKSDQAELIQINADTYQVVIPFPSRQWFSWRSADYYYFNLRVEDIYGNEALFLVEKPKITFLAYQDSFIPNANLPEEDEPSDSGDSSESDAPSNPSDPIDPGESDAPSNPSAHGESDAPSNPSDPIDPGESDAPRNPSDPIDPGESDVPSNPSDPIDPGVPNDPSEPITPNNPKNSNEPSKPNNPIKDSNSPENIASVDKEDSMEVSTNPDNNRPNGELTPVKVPTSPDKDIENISSERDINNISSDSSNKKQVHSQLPNTGESNPLLVTIIGAIVVILLGFILLRSYFKSPK